MGPVLEVLTLWSSSHKSQPKSRESYVQKKNLFLFENQKLG